MSATRNRRAALPGTRGLLPFLFSGVPHSSKGRPSSQKFAAPLDFPPICEQVMVPAASPVILLFAEINRRRNEPRHVRSGVCTPITSRCGYGYSVTRPNCRSAYAMAAVVQLGLWLSGVSKTCVLWTCAFSVNGRLARAVRQPLGATTY
jgi:hypothetical protein